MVTKQAYKIESPTNKKLSSLFRVHPCVSIALNSITPIQWFDFFGPRLDTKFTRSEICVMSIFVNFYFEFADTLSYVRILVPKIQQTRGHGVSNRRSVMEQIDRLERQ